MGYYCSECEEGISKEEYHYSVKHYGKVLCIYCQKDYIPKKRSYQIQKANSTREAIKLHEALIKMGFNAQLEKSDGHKHIDIAIPEFKVNIEVDGMQHQLNEEQALADLQRTVHSFRKGYVTLRIPNRLIQKNPFEAAGYVKKFIETSAKQLGEYY